MRSLFSRLFHSRLSWIAAGLLVVSAIPCQAESSPPLFVDPSFDPSKITEFDVYLVDLSVNKEERDSGPALDQNNRECFGGAWAGTNFALVKRGYNKVGRRGDKRVYAAKITPSEEMLLNPTHQWLQDLGDVTNVRQGKTFVAEHVPTGQWTMILVLNDLGSRDNAVKGLGKASMSIYLYDRTQATLLWHDQAEKNMWGGLLGNVMQKGEIKQSACQDMATVMIDKLPKHKEAKH